MAGKYEHDLTPRELDVLGFWAMGYTRDQIAVELYVTVSTVRTHINGINKKLGTGNAAGAAWEAMRRGIIDPPVPRLKTR